MSAPKVFISYSHDDAEWVHEFAEALSQEDVKVWLDEWEITPGDSLLEALETGLRESDVFIAVITQRNARSPNVFFELGIAFATGKRLIPIISSDLETAAIPFDLRTRRYLMRGSPMETAREVGAALKDSS